MGICWILSWLCIGILLVFCELVNCNGEFCNGEDVCGLLVDVVVGDFYD